MAALKHRYSQLDHNQTLHLQTEHQRIMSLHTALIFHKDGRVNHFLKAMSADLGLWQGSLRFHGPGLVTLGPMPFTLLLGLPIGTM